MTYIYICSNVLENECLHSKSDTKLMLYYVSNKFLTMYVPNNILLVVVVIVKRVVYLH